MPSPTSRSQISRSHATPDPPRSKNISTVLAESELQWLYDEDELLQTPSILNGMPVDTERELRVKGVTFIANVGGMLNVPQTTVTTAAVYFHRFLMRYSLKARPGQNPKEVLHHYQIAAVVLFIATKIEEHTRKLRDLVIACCRIAQKNPNLVVDEQTKDFWRWKDTIIHFEDLVLEILCFDLTIESPHVLFFTLIKRYGVGGNKALRSASWSFLNDSSMTPLCLLFSSRTIAVFALMYGACKEGPTQLPDERGMPWWEAEGVTKAQMQKAVAVMTDFYEKFPQKPGGSSSVFVGCLTDERLEETRLKIAQAFGTPDSARQLSAYANVDEWGGSSSRNKRRSEELDDIDMDDDQNMSGRPAKRLKSVDLLEPGEVLDQKSSNGGMRDSPSGSGSEEGEI